MHVLHTRRISFSNDGGGASLIVRALRFENGHRESMLPAVPAARRGCEQTRWAGWRLKSLAGTIVNDEMRKEYRMVEAVARRAGLIE